ncbi:MAG: hypothetical protein IAE78_05540 [Myxococcus sp.]|nr:hypothetical protein [Myxococcus sp.]
MKMRSALFVCAVVLSSCAAQDLAADAGPLAEQGAPDGGTNDAGPSDGGVTDGGPADAGEADAGAVADAGACRGTAVACSSRTPQACGALGCRLARPCVTSPCPRTTVPAVCNADPQCTYDSVDDDCRRVTGACIPLGDSCSGACVQTPEACSGTPTACPALVTPDACAMQLGCVWL